MKNVRVLSSEEEYRFLKKVCYLYDQILTSKVSHAMVDMTRSDWKELRNLLACLLMLDAGLRVGEMVQICYRDLYFHGEPVKTIIVRSAIAKGRTERTVPVSDRLRDVLILFRPERLLLAEWPLTQKVISRSREGTELTTRAVEKMTKWAGIRSINEPVNPHMLRHTFATKLMRITGMRTVQELLGHKSLNSTQIYTHPDSNDMRKAIENMNKPGEAPPAAGESRKCRICGCNQERACQEGRFWIGLDLCSVCAGST